MSDTITIYTDGSALGNPGPGGLGAVLIYKDKRKEIARGYHRTTNNRMELRAVIEALKSLKTSKHRVKVYSDSKYVVDAFNKGWLANWEKKNFKNRKNPDLWKELLALSHTFDIEWYWVKGHAGHNENERCDKLAVQAAQNPKLTDYGYEG